MKQRKYEVRVKRVVIAIPTSGNDGKMRLTGIYRYLGNNAFWDVQFIRSRIELTPELILKAINAGAEGFIIITPHASQTVKTILAFKKPLVFLTDDSTYPSAKGLSAPFISNVLTIDNTEIGKTAADHFLSLGRFSSFAYIPDTFGSKWSTLRGNAFKNRTKKSNKNFFEFKCFIDRPEERSWPRPALSKFIQSLTKPTAIFAANDNYACQALSVCRELGFSVPNQVSVLGVDNDPILCENAVPSLSSIEPAFDDEGFQAARTLDLLMSGNYKKAKIQAHTHPFGSVKRIVIRDSTCTLSPSSHLVEVAERFIEENARKGITPEDVAKHTRVSRSLLDLRFRELRGFTLAADIRNHRMEAVKNLLRKSSMPIADIAGLCGFRNKNYLKDLFHRTTGMTMRDWRRHANSPIVNSKR